MSSLSINANPFYHHQWIFVHCTIFIIYRKHYKIYHSDSDFDVLSALGDVDKCIDDEDLAQDLVVDKNKVEGACVSINGR